MDPSRSDAQCKSCGITNTSIPDFHFFFLSNSFVPVSISSHHHLWELKAHYNLLQGQKQTTNEMIHRSHYIQTILKTKNWFEESNQSNFWPKKKKNTLYILPPPTLVLWTLLNPIPAAVILQNLDDEFLSRNRQKQDPWILRYPFESCLLDVTQLIYKQVMNQSQITAFWILNTNTQFPTGMAILSANFHPAEIAILSSSSMLRNPKRLPLGRAWIILLN